MAEEKNKQKQKKEPCPLCKVSGETIKKLKEKEPSPKTPEVEIKKKTSWRIKALILIFIVGLVAIAFWKFPPSQSQEITLNQEQSEEKNQVGLLDILPKGLKVGDLAPDFASEDVYGNKTSLSDFQDKKPVLLIFWATWCGYCAQELPDLKTFTQEHQDEIQVIAIASGEAKKTIKDYIEKEEVNFLMLLDEQREIWNQYFIRGTPSHFLIDSGGKIASLRPGLAFKENLETMLTMLRK